MVLNLQQDVTVKVNQGVIKSSAPADLFAGPAGLMTPLQASCRNSSMGEAPPPPPPPPLGRMQLQDLLGRDLCHVIRLPSASLKNPDHRLSRRGVLPQEH